MSGFISVFSLKIFCFAKFGYQLAVSFSTVMCVRAENSIMRCGKWSLSGWKQIQCISFF